MRRPRTQPATRTTSRRGDDTTTQVTMATFNEKEEYAHYIESREFVEKRNKLN